MIHLDYRDARPIYSQIVDNFRSQIAAGILQEGDKLPSVRELATQLTINPNTIQRAYRELEAAGWIATVAGKGCFVSRPAAQSHPNDLFDAFDAAVAALLAQGFSADELAQRISQGGIFHD